MFYRGLAGSQVTLSTMVNQTRVMLEEQARHLLNEQERATMGYYLDEYKEGNISVDALVMALFELLNTHAKVRPQQGQGQFLVPGGLRGAVVAVWLSASTVTCQG